MEAEKLAPIDTSSSTTTTAELGKHELQSVDSGRAQHGNDHQNAGDKRKVCSLYDDLFNVTNLHVSQHQKPITVDCHIRNLCFYATAHGSV
jgi:hypothetical protein